MQGLKNNARTPKPRLHTGIVPIARVFGQSASKAAALSRIPSITSRGFTLIEIMIVVAIIAAVLAIGGPKLFNTKNQMRSAVRRLAVTTRDMRNVARLKNSTVRLVIDMSSPKTHKYIIESAPGTIGLKSEEQEKRGSKVNELTAQGRREKKQVHG